MCPAMSDKSVVLLGLSRNPCLDGSTSQDAIDAAQRHTAADANHTQVSEHPSPDRHHQRLQLTPLAP